MKKKRLFGILLSLVMVLGLMAGMSLTAYADNQKAYAAYDVTTNDNITKSGEELTELQVKFNEKSWYIIADDSTAVNAGTVTLLAADMSFGTSVFSDNESNAYISSTVNSKLVALTAEGGSFAGVKDAIVDTDLTDVGVTGAKLYLLNTTEANGVPENVRAFSSDWWLRSPSNEGVVNVAAVVDGYWDDVIARGTYVYNELGVRPALQLNLSSVIFDSESKTFSLKPTATVTKAPAAKSLAYTGSAQELVTAGEATGGEMQYALGNATEATEPYSTSIPTGIEAKIYFVWFKAVGDQHHSNSKSAFTNVVIAERNDSEGTIPTSEVTTQPSQTEQSQVQQISEEQITIAKKPTLKKPKPKKTKATIAWNKFQRKTKSQKATWRKIGQIELQWSTDPNFPAELTNKKVVGKRKTKTNITGLNRKTQYFVRLRYSEGPNGGYSRWSKVKRFKTK